MTSILTPQIKEAFTQLGQYLLSGNDEKLKELVNTAKHYNGWFTPEQIRKALTAYGSMLNEKDIELWFETEKAKADKQKSSPDYSNSISPKSVGLILAGNIPLVGLHDVLCVLACGHIAQIKLSSQDKYLIPYLLNKLTEIEPSLASRIKFTEKLQEFDAVIATGSNNTSRYFEYYFKGVPHIIRKNRNSIAILSGSESLQDLKALGNDIFDYFGLGCRNVSKIFVPEGYSFNHFFEAIGSFKDIINHHKYSNNYDYNKSVYLVNREPHLDNGFLLLRKTGNLSSGENTGTKDAGLSSPLAALYYEEYRDTELLGTKLQDIAEDIQCIVSRLSVPVSVQQVDFGDSQNPGLWDYADGVNTIQFLLSL